MGDTAHALRASDTVRRSQNVIGIAHNTIGWRWSCMLQLRMSCSSFFCFLKEKYVHFNIDRIHRIDTSRPDQLLDDELEPEPLSLELLELFELDSDPPETDWAADAATGLDGTAETSGAEPSESESRPSS